MEADMVGMMCLAIARWSDAVEILSPATQNLVPRRARRDQGSTMPNKIDRYLLRTFFKTFFVCLISLIGIYMVFDALTNMEEFLRCSDGFLDMIKQMGIFYGFKSLMLFDRTLGFIMLLSGVFTISWFQYHSEMTALMAAGVSRIRIVKPILLAGAAIVVVSVINREIVMPQFREELAKSSKDLAGTQGRAMVDQFDYKTDILLRGRKTYANEKRIEKPVFSLPGTDGVQLQAEDAYYHEAKDSRPAGYMFVGIGRTKDFDSIPPLAMDGKPVIYKHSDAPEWIKPNQCFVASGITFDLLTGGQAFHQFSSTFELIAGLRNPSLDFGPSTRTSIHCRITQPLLDFILLCLGLPLIASRNDRKIFLAVGIGGGLAMSVVLCAMICKQLGSTGWIAASLAAWLPLIFFVPVNVPIWETLAER